MTVVACGGGEASPEAPVAATEPAPVATPASDGGDLGMVSSRGTKATGATGEPRLGEAASAAGLMFALPEGWRQEAPSSSMRLAQAAIPGPGGEGQLAVFFFGPGGGGGVEANLDRWVGQMVPPAGATPSRDSFETGDLRVTFVELDGTLKASQFGMGPAEDQEGFRLFGAVVEGQGGPWFFKITGPEATIKAERENALAMLRDLRRGA